VATTNEDRYLQITHRAEDMIKSGGEWIGSIDLENVAAGHPGVLEAAVIEVFHPKLDECPILIIVPHGATGKVEKKTLREKFKDHKIPTA
jgi:fatty-acyl-CoA synthase